MEKIPLKTDFQVVPIACSKAQSLELHPEITNEKFLSATNPTDQWFSKEAPLPVENVLECLEDFF